MNSNRLDSSKGNFLKIIILETFHIVNNVSVLILASGSVGQSPSAIQTSGERPTKYHQKMKSEGEDGDG